MKITHIHVSNFRNLDGLDVYLHPEVNFLVGENELGKSNFLDLLDTVFNRRSFFHEDFDDETKPLEVKLTITLSDEEIGSFEDYFDPTDSRQANFIAKQDTPEDLIMFFRAENYDHDPKEIPSSIFRRINFIKYSSMRSPKEELGFDRERGVGRFLNYLIRSTLEGNRAEILNGAVLDPIIQRIDTTLKKIKPLRKMGIGTFVDRDHHDDLLARVLLLKNGSDFDIQKSGQGIQFSIILILSILERLISLKTSKRWGDNIFSSHLTSIPKNEFDQFLQKGNISGDSIQDLVTISEEIVSLNTENLLGVNTHENHVKRLFERKGASIVLGLDEPEIHLHPYMQRSLIKFIVRILSNKDADFVDLLTELLDLNEITGQAIVVSHSPNILLDDYHHIVRFYRTNGHVKSISGSNLTFDNQIEKHLLMNFASIKESFFSKCVIVVEGKTEQGAMSIWKDQHLGDADDLGITVIGADSCSSVKPIVRLLDALCIPNVSIMDADNDNREKYADIPNIHFTVGRDFEEDFYVSVSASEPKCDSLFSILDYFNSRLATFQKRERLIETADKYGIEKNWDVSTEQFRFSDEEVKNNSNLRKSMFIGFFGTDKVKSISLGRYMATKTKSIPPAYIAVLDEAVRKTEAAI